MFSLKGATSNTLASIQMSHSKLCVMFVFFVKGATALACINSNVLFQNVCFVCVFFEGCYCIGLHRFKCPIPNCVFSLKGATANTLASIL